MSDYELRPDRGRYDRLSYAQGSGAGVWLAIAGVVLVLVLGIMFVGTGDQAVAPADQVPSSERPLGPPVPHPAR